MLCELNIRNFVIIDSLTVRFGEGFNVLTGETGAGKSIIIDAIDLILGGKARPDLIRSGEEEATVEALFDLQPALQLRAELEEAGIENGNELLVRRTLTRSGKNRIYVNGTLATAVQLQNWVSRLVAIYGQHEQMGLARPETHLGLLDHFAGAESQTVAYRNCYDQIRNIQSELTRLDLAERERQQRLDLLSFQRQEIAEAALKIGEEAELVAGRAMMQHAEKLVAAAEGGYEFLYNGEAAVCGRLAVVAASLRELTRIDPHLGVMTETIDNAYYALEDVALQLRNYADKISYDPVRLEQSEQRLALISSLKRKYGADIESILVYLLRADEEFLLLSDIDGTREALKIRLDELNRQLFQIGSGLTELRQIAALRLQKGIETELQDLAMAKARFEVRLSALPEPGPRGCERVEFFLQANPGEEARPLARVASGGELSRLMLAIKRAAPAGEEIATLIFDEVDSGIGGVAATAVGEKLRGVATGRQVLCITHLPQVAAFADRHYMVSKLETANARTRAEVIELDSEERANEMARMLGGAKVTEQSLAHARELIRLSAHQVNVGGIL